MSDTSTAATNTGGTKKGRGKKRIFIGLGVLLFVLVVLVAVAPMIASSMAPGIIESAASKSIAGKVKVDRVSVGWFSPVSAGPITLSDPKGEKVATVRAETQLTLMKVLSGRMWSATDLDVGTVTLNGDVDLIQETDGTTNLSRAIAPPAGQTGAAQPSATQPSSTGSSSAGRSIKAAVKLDTVTLTRRVRGADGKVSEPTGVKGLAGQIDAAVDTRSGLTAQAKGKLTGTPVGPGTNAGGAMSVNVDADVKQGASAPGVSAIAALERAKVDVTVQGAPVALVDGLVGLGGGLLASAGETANVEIKVDGTLRALDGSMVVASPGLNVRLPVQIKDGVVRSGATSVEAQGGTSASRTLTLKTTEGLALLPQLRAVGEQLGKQVRLSQWPTLEVTLEQLRLPSPVDASGKPTDLATVDFRGAAVVLRVRASEMAGEVLVQDAAGAAAANGANQTNGAWRAFRTEPIEVVVNVPDLAQGLSVSGGTKATLDNQPAGDVTIKALAAGLLDERGLVRALQKSGGLANSVDVELMVKGLSTALIAPVVAGMGVPVDVQEDVGPVATLGLTAKMAGELSAATGQGGLGTLPPVDVRVNLDAANMNVAGALRLEKGILSTSGNDAGLIAKVASGGALAKRLTRSADGKDSGLIAGGRGGMEVRVSGLRADLNKLMPPAGAAKADPLTAISAAVHASVTDLSVRLPAGAGEGAADANGAAPKPLSPIDVRTLVLDVSTAPGTAPKIKLDSAMASEGAPFTLSGDLSLEGLTSGKMPALNGTPIDQLVAVRPVGKVGLNEVPKTILNAIPAGISANMPSDGSIDPVAIGIDAMGRWVSASVQFAPDQEQPSQHAARLLVETESKAAGVSLLAKLAPAQAVIAGGQVFVKAEPATLNPILAKMVPTVPNAAGFTPRAMSVTSPSTLWVKVVQPITVPLEKDAAGSLKPNLEKASDAVVSIAAQGDVTVAGISLGGDGSAAAPFKYLDVMLVGVAGEVRAPSGSLGNAPTRPPMQASLAADVYRGDRQPIGSVKATASIAGNRSNGSTTDAEVTIDRLATATLDDTLALDGLLQGFVGDTAKVTLKTTMSTSQTAGSAAGASATSSINVLAAIDAPRISGASVRMMKDNDRLALVDPANITLTPDPAFINRLAGAANIPNAQATPAHNQQPVNTEPARRRPGEEIGRALDGIFGGKKDGNAAAAAPAAKDLATKMKLLDAERVNLKLSKLSIALPRSEGTGDEAKQVVGPLKPGLFDLDVGFETPKLGLEVVQVSKDGAAAFNPVRASFAGIRGSAKSIAPTGANDGPGVQVDLNIDRVASSEVGSAANAQGPAAGKPSRINATISGLADRAGVLNTSKAVISADVDVEDFPTPIADQLAGQNGLMTEVLGTSVSLQAKLRNVTTAATGAAGGQAGSLEATAKSPRASASIKGDVKDGAFIQTGKTQVVLTQISPALVQMLSGGLPIVDSLEKTAQDEPATIELSDFRAPLDQDLRKLNGRVAVDLGVARFTTKSVFGQLIKAAGGNETGMLGRKIEPFIVTAKSGVLDYQRFKLPLGEFNLETQGEVDLVGRQIRVTTYAPFFAIAEEALGPIKLGLGGKVDVINRNTMVPITTRGSLEGPKTEIDIGAFLKEVGGNVISGPGGLLEDLLGKDKDKNKDKDQQTPGKNEQPKEEPKPRRGLTPFDPKKPKENPK